LTGFSTPKGTDAYDPTLLRLKEDGEVEHVADVLPGHVGTDWIGVSYDGRKAVFFSKWLASIPRRTLGVVNFDNPEVIKRCEIPDVAGAEAQASEWLTDHPVRGLSFQRYLGTPDLTETLCRVLCWIQRCHVKRALK